MDEIGIWWWTPPIQLRNGKFDGIDRVVLRLQPANGTDNLPLLKMEEEMTQFPLKASRTPMNTTRRRRKNVGHFFHSSYELQIIEVEMLFHAETDKY